MNRRPLILWGDPETMEQPVMVESMPIEPEVDVEEELPPEGEPELMLEAEALPPTDDEVGTLQITPKDIDEQPILGINPEESGEIISRNADTVEEIPQPTWRVVVRVLQIAMGAVLIGGGLTWWLLHRHGLS